MFYDLTTPIVSFVLRPLASLWRYCSLTTNHLATRAGLQMPPASDNLNCKYVINVHAFEHVYLCLYAKIYRDNRSIKLHTQDFMKTRTARMNGCLLIELLCLTTWIYVLLNKHALCQRIEDRTSNGQHWQCGTAQSSLLREQVRFVWIVLQHLIYLNISSSDALYFWRQDFYVVVKLIFSFFFFRWAIIVNLKHFLLVGVLLLLLFVVVVIVLY